MDRIRHEHSGNGNNENGIKTVETGFIFGNKFIIIHNVIIANI